MNEQILLPESVRTIRTEEYSASAAHVHSDEASAEIAAVTAQDAQVQALAATLNCEVRANRKTVTQLMVAMLAITLSGIFLMDLVARFTGSGFASFMALTTVCITTTCLLISILKPRKRRRKLTAQITRHRDVRLIGPLVNSLSTDDAKMHEIAIEGLIHLLPDMKASDASLLNAAHRSQLCRILSLPIDLPAMNASHVLRFPNEQDVELRLAILRAFEQVGDSKAFPIVERLANMDAKSPRQARIKEAAALCLPALSERAQLEISSRTLLRASAAAPISSDTLLRPASATLQTPHEELLRPGSQ